MVDPETGNPTPFFMSWWQQQVESNAAIVDLSTPEAVSAVLDVITGGTQGAVLFRGNTLWEILAPGTDGSVLRTRGVANDPRWDNISLVLDDALGSDQGNVLYRGASGWAVLAPGTDGEALITKGAGADPEWGSVASDLVSAASFLEKYEGTQGTWTLANAAQAGDVIVLFGSTDVQDGTTKLISGFTQIDQRTDSSPSAIGQYKIITAGDLPFTSITLPDFGSSTHNTQWVGGHFRGSGGALAGTTPVRVDGSGSAPAPPAITTTVDLALVVIMAGLDDDPSAVITHPAGYTVMTADFGAFNSKSMMAAKIVETAGPETPGAFSSSTSDDWTAMTVAFTPGEFVPITEWIGLNDTPGSITADALVHGDGAGSTLAMSTVSDYLDARFTSDVGTILQRGTTGWEALAPGTAQQILTTKGPGVEAEYDDLRDVMEELGTVQGSILYRNATEWVVLPPGTADHVLKTKGASANPVWEAESGGGGGGSSTFLGLTDTPSAFTSQAGKAVAVNVGETALEFIDFPSGGGGGGGAAAGEGTVYTELLFQDFSVTALGTTNVEVADIDQYDRIDIIIEDVANQIVGELSADGGSTWITSGLKRLYTSASSDNYDTVGSFFMSTSAGSNGASWKIHNAANALMETSMKGHYGGNTGQVYLQETWTGSAGVHNRLRFRKGGGADLTTGSIRIVGVQYKGSVVGGVGSVTEDVLVEEEIGVYDLGTGAGQFDLVSDPIVVTGIDQYHEIEVYLDDGTSASAAVGAIQLSADGGSTWLAGTSYRTLLNGGVLTRPAAIFTGEGTSQVHGTAVIKNHQSAASFSRVEGFDGLGGTFQYTAHTMMEAAGAHNAMRIVEYYSVTSGTRDFTGGKVRIVGKKKVTITIPDPVVSAPAPFSGARVEQTTTPNTINTTASAVAWSDEIYDTDGYFDSGSNDRFTIPEDGYYELVFSVDTATVGVDVFAYINDANNDVTPLAYTRLGGTSGSKAGQATYQGFFSAGDEVYAVADIASGSVTMDANAANSFTIRRMDGSGAPLVYTPDTLGPWADVNASRSFGTNYQNTGATNRHVAIGGLRDNVTARRLQVSSDASTWITVHRSNNVAGGTNMYAVVPPGWYYRVDPSGSPTGLDSWAEAQEVAGSVTGAVVTSASVEREVIEDITPDNTVSEYVIDITGHEDIEIYVGNTTAWASGFLSFELSGDGGITAQDLDWGVVGTSQTDGHPGGVHLSASGTTLVGEGPVRGNIRNHNLAGVPTTFSLHRRDTGSQAYLYDGGQDVAALTTHLVIKTSTGLNITAGEITVTGIKAGPRVTEANPLKTSKYFLSKALDPNIPLVANFPNTDHAGTGGSGTFTDETEGLKMVGAGGSEPDRTAISKPVPVGWSVIEWSQSRITTTTFSAPGLHFKGPSGFVTVGLGSFSGGGSQLTIRMLEWSTTWVYQATPVTDLTLTEVAAKYDEVFFRAVRTSTDDIRIYYSLDGWSWTFFGTIDVSTRLGGAATDVGLTVTRSDTATYHHYIDEDLVTD